MEKRLNERKQRNEHNQKKGIVNRKIIPHLHRNVYPERRFCGHIAETCTRKGGFGYMWDWQGLMDSNHRMTESESVALPLGEAPMKMAGVDGVKPPSADLESAGLLN